MKDFEKFLEEVTIRGNKGIPGEGSGRETRGEEEYLRNIERRAKQRLEITGREDPRRFIDQLMGLLPQSAQYINGHETELEELAKRIILDNYGDILEGVEFDIKLVTGNQVGNFMEQEQCEDCSSEPPPEFRDITDQDLIDKIYKSKIANNIIQGEAKNTKHILHSEGCKEGIEEIYGNRWENIFEIWDNITKLADRLDWLIPIEVKSRMMEEQPAGMAGAVKVDWKVKEYKPEEDKPQDQQEDPQESKEEIFDEYTPVIRVRGVDFPMLLHEAVKGIYELIASITFPSESAPEEERKEAETIRLNVSSYEDEVEDFRTGPEIAADFRDFINENPKTSDYPNMRAFVFGKMMDPEYMSANEFLRLFRGILNKTDEARQKVDDIIDSIIKELKNYELAVLGFVDTEPEPIVEPETTETETEDYSTWTQSALQDAVDKALDDGDYDTVRKLSLYLKEGKEIYLNEIERIVENYQCSITKGCVNKINPHTK